MGKKWDASGIAYDPTVWTECLRVLKPGGHLLAFGGTRTYHRMTVAIEDAGFEIRDSLHWLYGSGFPKSLDVSKAIDKACGIWRGRAGPATSGNTAMAGPNYERTDKGEPATPAAAAAAGWGTALKPAHEPIVLARKPLTGTVAANVLEYGTGALNIDATRVIAAAGDEPLKWETPRGGIWSTDATATATATAGGRWPANLVLTHSPECATECVPECPVAILDGQSGITRDGVAVNRNRTERKPSTVPFVSAKIDPTDVTYGGSGGASRFFTTTTWDPEMDAPFLYVPKPNRRERNAGLDGMPTGHTDFGGNGRPGAGFNEVVHGTAPTPAANFHPTVKPVALVRHLIRLITPPGGTVLDPFLGSGTTAVAAILEGFDWIGCELTPDYLPIIEARVAWAETQTPDPVQPELFT
jgi:hypothetical protein